MPRRLLSHIFVAAVALAVGMAGTAGAAKLLTGKNIKDGTIELKDLSKKTRKKLAGKAGPRGPAGPVGTAGATGPAGTAGATGPLGPAGAAGKDGLNGAQGLPGTSGSTAPALLFGNASVTPGTMTYSGPGTGPTGSEAGAQVPVPPGAGLTARDFSAAVKAAVGAGQTVALSLNLNGVPTGLGCTVTGPATTCESGGNTTVALPSGGKIAVVVTSSAGAPNTAVSYGMRVVF